MPTDRTVQLNYISDIHLEWLFDKRGLLQTDVLDEIYRPLFRCNRQPATQHNLLMIAGDLTEVRKFHYFVPFLESVIADNGFDRVFYVMGNHEYYGDALHKVVGRIQAALDGSPMLKAHMSILHNQCATLDNGRVQIIGAPFWYQVAHGDEYAVAQRLSDYRYIKVKNVAIVMPNCCIAMCWQHIIKACALSKKRCVPARLACKTSCSPTTRPAACSAMPT